MARSMDRWATQPGSTDALHLSPSFGVPVGRNVFEVPDIMPTLGLSLKPVTKNLVGYDQRNTVKVEDRSKTWLHFFLDDYRFECVWNQPKRYLDIVKGYAGVLAPDFSAYPEWPMAAKLWNVYRSRWCARYWQEHGVTVIPVVTWAEPASFEYALDGLPHDAPLAIAVPHIYHEDDVRDAFYEGVKRVLDTLHPPKMLVYGKDKDGMLRRLGMATDTRMFLVEPQRPHIRLTKPRQSA
jgi:uncharacterized protein DUF4417